MQWLSWLSNLFKSRCQCCHKPDQENKIRLFTRTVAGTGRHERLYVCPDCYESLTKYYATPTRRR